MPRSMHAAHGEMLFRDENTMQMPKAGSSFGICAFFCAGELSLHPAAVHVVSLVSEARIQYNSLSMMKRPPDIRRNQHRVYRIERARQGLSIMKADHGKHTAGRSICPGSRTLQREKNIQKPGMDPVS